MMLVTKRHWLVEWHIDLVDVVYAIDIEKHPQATSHDEKHGEDAGLGRPVGAARKYLSH
jgi:hypothetical protein